MIHLHIGEFTAAKLVLLVTYCMRGNLFPTLLDGQDPEPDGLIRTPPGRHKSVPGLVCICCDFLPGVLVGPLTVGKCMF